jgi:hypothetical protein
MCSAVAVGKRLRHDSTHLVEEWREGVDGVNRWDTEAPHPKLTFAEAWADRKAYTPLFLLKLYSPTFTGYGSYAGLPMPWFAHERPRMNVVCVVCVVCACVRVCVCCAGMCVSLKTGRVSSRD